MEKAEVLRWKHGRCQEFAAAAQVPRQEYNGGHPLHDVGSSAVDHCRLSEPFAANVSSFYRSTASSA